MAGVMQSLEQVIFVKEILESLQNFNKRKIARNRTRLENLKKNLCGKGIPGRGGRI